MALTSTPYGLRPIGASGSAPYSGGTSQAYRITQNNTNAIFTNGWVTMNAGKVDGSSAVAPVSTAETAAPSATQTVLGVVTGIQYTDPILKYTLFAQYLPASAVTAGYTNIIVFVTTDVRQLYMIQADAAILQASIGLNLDMSVETGVITTGLSTISASGPAATITLPLKIIDLVNQSSLFGGGLSAPGDAFTDCIVRFNRGVLHGDLRQAV